LKSCTTDCHPPAQSSFLPTRLLDLGADGTASPRLIIAADLLSHAEVPRYAALSYSWGNEAAAATQTKTEKSNFHERLQGIPPHDMSAVLRDSIQVCRSMSVRYLWIDALCIIQDRADPSDWERESARVGQVYQNAYFTICAVSTSSCHESFLARSQHTFEFDFQSFIYPPARGKYTLHYTGEYDGTPNHDPISNDLRYSPWNDRGWVFQEQELSARKLLFGHHMVHFQCSMSEESENGEVFSAPVAIDWFDLDQQQVYDYFRETTQVYAARLLSYESDRLPALAGLAQRVFESTGSRYLAGLWQDDLHLGLLWHSPRTTEILSERLSSLRASTGSGAPSWSWVSQRGRIEYSSPLFRYFSTQRRVRKEYTAIDAETTLKGACLNQFGDVTSGIIRVRGKVADVPTDCMLDMNDDGQNKLWRGSKHGTIKLSNFYTDWIPAHDPLGGLRMMLLSSGCGRRKDKEAEGDENGEAESEESGSEDGGDEDGVSQDEDVSPSLAQPSETETESTAGRVCSFCNDPEHSRDAGGLILHPAEKPGEYYRVGVFDSRADEAGGTRLFDGVEEEWICII
ncbi:heterokaryon incompatibility protein-domain-containing protein, partial [Staphylotrichum tortipilum]